MKKICLINSLYPPHHRGGAEVIVKKIADGLKNDYQVILITLGRKDSKTVEGNLTIYRIKPFNIFSFIDIGKHPFWQRIFWHPLDIFNFSGYKKVENILNTEKTEIVMTHNLKGIGYLIPRLIKKLGIKHIHTLHDVQLVRPSGLIIFGQEKPFVIIDKIYERITRKLFGSPDVIISPSAWLLDYYTKGHGFFTKSQSQVLPNPIEFKKVEKQDRLEDEKIKLLYVGQLETSKGIIFLINAIKKVSSSNLKLTIAGTGSLEKKIIKIIEGDSRFEMVGWVDQKKLIDYYRAADLTVVPSFCYENSPTVIYESLVANVPVIASDIGGIGELVKDDYNGFTFAPQNEKNLIDVLNYFISKPEQINKLKKNCFISVREFSLGNYIKKIISFL